MRALFLASLLLTVTLAGCSSSDSTTETTSDTTTTTTTTMDHAMGNHNVTIDGSKFVNGTLTVMMGDTVTWIHADGNTAHTVTADDNSFDSSPNCGVGGLGVPLSQVCLVEPNTFGYKFTKAGSFPYHCKLHSSMTGNVTVEAMQM